MNQIESFTRLRHYCEAEDYKGWDPYDGLNSKLFKATPFFNKSPFFRLAIIQGFKKCPINLRKVALVPKGYNSKGIGLFLQGYCNLYYVQKKIDIGITEKECIDRINYLANLLISLQSKGYSGACWGYNFDWQSKAFFLPENTPTVVATSFVAEALLSAYQITHNKDYLSTACSSADFILKDLKRIPKKRGYMFSYSPIDNRAVYNASLLGSKTLSLIYSHTHDAALKEAAQASVTAVCDMQNKDGSFPHSDQVGNKWRDNFHTGFKLESLSTYQNLCEDYSFSNNLEHGTEYWLENFFIKETGIAKYYDTSNESGLIDLHCYAQAIPTIYKLNIMHANKDLINNLLDWAINNMQSEDGYYYFQKKGKSINKIPYMRWPNAWMFYGISYWLLFKSEDQ